MHIERIRALRGPNLWARCTVIEATVALSEDEMSVDRMPGFEERLLALFPEVESLRAPAPRTALNLAEVLERVCLRVQTAAGCEAAFSRTVATVKPGVFLVAVEYAVEEVGHAALSAAVELCHAATGNAPFDLGAALDAIREADEEKRLGPSTGAIVRAAIERGIPIRRLNEQSLVQLGWGARQHRILAAETDRTGAIAESIAQDKDLTKMLLQSVGVPAPKGRPVTSADDAWETACEIGVPVVVKPRYGNQGRGVAVNLVTEEQIRAAYGDAVRISSSVLVERFIPGDDYRLLVIGGRLVAAARRRPPHVIGDGVHPIHNLVEQVNTDPRRRQGHATSLSRIPLDAIAREVLAGQGLTPESVPLPGQLVILRRNANLSTGGTATDVTDDVHPDIAARAVDAARAVGLDICGVDLVCSRIDRSLDEQEAAVVEVNAAPGFRMHLDPSFGKGRQVGRAVIDMMFAAGDNGRVPLVAVSGTNGKTTTVRLISHMLKTSGRRVGMTCSDGIYIDGQRIDCDDCSGPKSARAVLANPLVDAAVLETARGGILREGLGFDRCDVGVVTNIGSGDHLGLSFIDTVEDLAVVKRVIVQNVGLEGMAVLNAEDPITAVMADECPGSVTFFAWDRQNPVLARHREKGGRVVYVADKAIVAEQAGLEQRFPLAAIAITRNGRIGFQVENAMAAISSGWALGLSWRTIAEALGSFMNDIKTAPGRFNVLSYREATVIADYGHNPDAIKALVSAVERIPSRRRLVVISGAGDRRDADIRRQGQILGETFDEAILYQDKCQRGREDGEVIALLRDGFANSKRGRVIAEIRGEFLAIDTALERLGPGDLALILIDQVDDALRHIEQRIAESLGAAASANGTTLNHRGAA